MYQNMHNGNTELELQLQTKIVDAYTSFIDFSLEVSKFYLQRGIGRLHDSFCIGLNRMFNTDTHY